MLNSDELGEKGQSRFKEICVDAKLVCNLSTRDRTGWDFIVEFPFEAPKDESTLDKRKAPISCHVQVKTMWTSTKNFRLRLSSAERLAKEAKPAFIYVFRVNDQLQFADSFLIHILDANLGLILKRLRKEHARGCYSINHKWIVFDPKRVGQQIKPTGKSLYNIIKSICEPDLEKYIQKKNNQLVNLGFSQMRYEIKGEFEPMSYTEFVDVFLGLRKADVFNVESFENRFDIKLPMSQPNLPKSEMEVYPAEVDRCKIVVRGTDLFPPAIFDGSIFFPPIPNLPIEQIKCVIKTDCFELVLGPSSPVFKTFPVHEMCLDVSQWQNFARSLVLLYKGGSSVTIKPTKITNDITFVVPLKSEEDSSQWALLLEAFEGLEKLSKLSGTVLPRIMLNEISGIVEKLGVANRLFSDSPGVPPFVFKPNDQFRNVLPQRFNSLLVDFVSIHEINLAYYAIAEIIPEQREDYIVFTCHNVKPCEILALQSLQDDYSLFIEKAKKNTNVDSVISMQPSTT